MAIEWADQHWVNNRPPIEYVCGFCSRHVSSVQGTGGYEKGDTSRKVSLRACTNCGCPTYFGLGNQVVPSPRPGTNIDHVKEEVYALYNEARDCVAAGANTAAVMVCRKILMNVAVEKEAAENKSFAHYVDHLASEGYIPPNGKDWVDYIRKLGNTANHEIRVMKQEEAMRLVQFVELLLKFVYEFPALVPKDDPKAEATP